MEGTRTRLREVDARRPWLLDTGLAVALFVASATAAALPGPQHSEPDTTLYVLLALGSAPYALRRRAPMTVLVAASLPVLVILDLGYSSAVIGAGLFLAAYTVAAWRPPRIAAVAATYTAILLVVLWALVPQSMTFAELATNAALFLGAFTLGLMTRTRRENVLLLRERAEMAERARADGARRAVSEERLRLARELHDVVAHSLGVISVQAGVGAHVLDRDPAEARAALVAIAQRSGEALAEIRGILGALRAEDGGAPSTEPLGLDDLPGLAEEFSEAGLPVTITVTGNPVQLPAMVDLTAYRMVQEGLTNTLRHAGPARAEVLVAHEPGAVRVEVIDDGQGTAPGTEGPGHGLLGMHERATALNGSFESGPRPGGGYRVAARLPHPQEAPE